MLVYFGVYLHFSEGTVSNAQMGFRISDLMHKPRRLTGGTSVETDTHPVSPPSLCSLTSSTATLHHLGALKRHHM